MPGDLPQLIYLLMAGAVVLLGARWQLREQPWGETAWRVMLALFVGVAIVAVVLIVSRN